jgi:hypothetical protein
MNNSAKTNQKGDGGQNSIRAGLLNRLDSIIELADLARKALEKDELHKLPELLIDISNDADTAAGQVEDLEREAA